MLVVPLSPELEEGRDRAHLPHLWEPMPHTASGRDDTDIKWGENVPISAASFGILTGQELSGWMKICGLAGWWHGRRLEGSILGSDWQEPGQLNGSAFRRNSKCLGKMAWRGLGGPDLTLGGWSLGLGNRN